MINNRATIVEFMGLPSAGKSTLSKIFLKSMRDKTRKYISLNQAVLQSLRRRDDGIMWNMVKRLPYAFWEPMKGERFTLLDLQRFASSNSNLFEIVFEVFNRHTTPQARKQCILGAFIKRSIEWQLIEDHIDANTKVVIDEGFALGSFTLFNILPTDNRPASDIERYVDSIPLPWRVIWVDTAAEECTYRLAQREEPPLLWNGCKPESVTEKLTAGRECMNKTAQELKKRGVEVYRIDNTQKSLETVAAEIESLSKMMIKDIEGDHQQNLDRVQA